MELIFEFRAEVRLAASASTKRVSALDLKKMSGGWVITINLGIRRWNLVDL